jgi:3,4-dihydroxy-2-butanone 4-phosphate synthase
VVLPAEDESVLLGGAILAAASAQQEQVTTIRTHCGGIVRIFYVDNKPTLKL